MQSLKHKSPISALALTAAEGADKLMHAANHLASAYCDKANPLLVSQPQGWTGAPGFAEAQAVRMLTERYFELVGVVIYCNSVTDRYPEKVNGRRVY